jgi:hypothetical protein
MRAYIMIVALAVLAMFALAYTAGTPDRTYAAGFTVDCSGYEAGYRWAEQNSIDDEDYCPDGDSESFHEGCIRIQGQPDRSGALHQRRLTATSRKTDRLSRFKLHRVMW